MRAAIWRFTPWALLGITLALLCIAGLTNSPASAHDDSIHAPSIPVLGQFTTAFNDPSRGIIRAADVQWEPGRPGQHYTSLITKIAEIDRPTLTAEQIVALLDEHFGDTSWRE